MYIASSVCCVFVWFYVFSMVVVHHVIDCDSSFQAMLEAICTLLDRKVLLFQAVGAVVVYFASHALFTVLGFGF